MKKPQKYVSKDEALSKLQKYCAYQDRCHKEVEKKIRDYGIYGDDVGDIMVELIRERFLDEERFACSYARGKFRMKKWGKTRIKLELKKRDVSKYCIKKAMKEIENEEYTKVLREILDKKMKQYKGKFYERKIKAARFALGKGYESVLVWKLANELEEEQEEEKTQSEKAKHLFVLEKLLEKKMREYKGNFYEKKMKSARYIIDKGYDSKLVWELINELEG